MVLGACFGICVVSQSLRGFEVPIELDPPKASKWFDQLLHHLLAVGDSGQLCHICLTPTPKIEVRNLWTLLQKRRWGNFWWILPWGHRKTTTQRYKNTWRLGRNEPCWALHHFSLQTSTCFQKVRDGLGHVQCCETFARAPRPKKTKKTE